MGAIQPKNIPQELRDRPQWLVWKFEKDSKGRVTKVPYNAKSPTRKASTTNPETWTTFTAAVQCASRKTREGGRVFDGVGFVLSAEDPYCFIDLDHALGLDSGKPAYKPWAKKILRACESYQEMSPSGTGVHVITRAKLPGKGLNKRKINQGDEGAIEIYDSARYMTMTGNHLPDSPSTIEDQSALIQKLYQKLSSSNGDSKRKVASVSAGMNERLEKALGDAVFARLWNGDTSGNGDDDSAADLALCNKLAFYFGHNPELIDELFRKSGLMRDKWDREDYRTWTIDKAIAGTHETYTPPKTGRVNGKAGATNAPINDPDAKKSDGGDFDTGHKTVLANLNNAVKILETDPQFCPVWFDEFKQRVLTKDPEREWTDADDIHLTLRFQREKKIPSMALKTVSHAVTEIAFRNPRNCVKDWLKSLKWDGIDRLETFFEDYYGTEGTAYTKAAGKNFLISMVARIYEPGCQVDTMPVLEGPQGILKSSSLRALAGEHHSEQHETVTSKDFFQNLQGKWLIEISEMHAFNKTETAKVKQVISCTTDYFRPSYGHRALDHPRQCVFVGTTNHDDWNKDETGARRFWPIACTEIDLDGIRTHRDQLFAEAVHRFKAHESWWMMPAEETLLEQQKRYDADAWISDIEEFIRVKAEVSVREIMIECLKFDLSKLAKTDQMRVGNCLRALGWKRDTKWRGKPVKVWYPPKKE